MSTFSYIPKLKNKYIKIYARFIRFENRAYIIYSFNVRCLIFNQFYSAILLLVAPIESFNRIFLYFQIIL